jgi:Zn-dependent peptidase ImmA (M78 family)/DNA-binding XRE family transcriptional regulator
MAKFLADEELQDLARSTFSCVHYPLRNKRYRQCGKGCAMLELESIDPRILGQRLAEARKARGLTQEQVADFLECSRPTYIAIEKGERPLKPDEIIKLAEFFGRSVHELVRTGKPVIGLQPHLRAVAERMRPDDKDGLLDAISEMHRLAEDYRELERIMKATLRDNYPLKVTLSSHIDEIEQAESVAAKERQRLGLGDQPVINLRSLLEWDVGLRIFYWPLPSPIAGMYAHVPDLGGCILINRKHPPERRRVSMLHEYAHLIVDRYAPGIDYLRMPGRKPNERFAEAFAVNFLMPSTSVRQRFTEIVNTTGDFQVADLCRLCHFYFVSAEAMTLQLERLALIPKGSWGNIKESKFAVRKAGQILQLPPQTEPDDPYPERYKFLAVHAYEQEKIGDSELAHYLRCDIVTAREIVAQTLTSREVVESTGEERQLQLEFGRSLLKEVS